MKYELLDLSKEINILNKLNISPFAIGISFIGQGDTYLTFQITSATPVPYNRAVYWSLDGQNLTTYIYANSTTSIEAHFTNLNPGTYYTVSCSVTGDYPWSSSRTVKTTGISYSKPVNFNWSSKAKNAMLNKGNFKELTATEWNSFIENVSNTINWYYQNSTGENVKNAFVSPGEVLTATKFNLVKNAIGGIVQTGISNQSRGDIVYGEYFITLSQKLGAIKNLK